MATEQKTKKASGECVHHWQISSPKGSMSVGTCRLCGAEREFQNAEPSYMGTNRSKTKAKGKSK
jgi:hypothetical protein